MTTTQARKATKTDLLVTQLQQDIIGNIFAPGERLTMSALKARYKTGATPLREALSRLSSQGFVEIEPQCGGRVPSLSRDELHDIYRIREVITSLAITLIAENADDAWEAEFLTTWYQLHKYLTSRCTKDTREWEKLQRSFFHILIKGAKSPWLLKLHDMLYDQAARYRRLCINKNYRNTKNLAHYAAEDQLLVDAILAKNIHKANLIFKRIWKDTVTTIEALLEKDR
jgi:GntR family transcriptional regulator, carbon starvation induced regulator